MSQQAGSTDQLSTGLRMAAARAVQMAGGGCSMVFVVIEDHATGTRATRLRAASGFTSPDATRAAAATILSAVDAVIAAADPGTIAAPPALQTYGAETLTAVPAACNGTVLGALVVGAPGEIDASTRSAFGELASTIGVQLDHERLSREVAQLRGSLNEKAEVADAKSDELLKLSEALFAQDIELMRNNEKLGTIEKLKNDFIEKMSRELRTPLNSIIEATISVLAGENDRLSDHAKSSLRHALDEGTAFQRTLQNILDLWRIKQCELPVELQEVNFNEIVDEAIFSVQDTVDDKPIVIEKDFEPLPTIKTDLAKTNQILFLLLDNAAKFTAEGRIAITARLEDDVLYCDVSDPGIGICADDQQFVFDEFFQVDELSSTRYRGAGLGLALVRDLLVLLEGEVSMTSEAGKGTSIGFRIPIVPVL